LNFIWWESSVLVESFVTMTVNNHRMVHRNSLENEWQRTQHIPSEVREFAEKSTESTRWMVINITERARFWPTDAENQTARFYRPVDERLRLIRGIRWAIEWDSNVKTARKNERQSTMIDQRHWEKLPQRTRFGKLSFLRSEIWTALGWWLNGIEIEKTLA
jgi:hypothetical protein